MPRIHHNHRRLLFLRLQGQPHSFGSRCRRLCQTAVEKAEKKSRETGGRRETGGGAKRGGEGLKRSLYEFNPDYFPTHFPSRPPSSLPLQQSGNMWFDDLGRSDPLNTDMSHPPLLSNGSRMAIGAEGEGVGVWGGWSGSRITSLPSHGAVIILTFLLRPEERSRYLAPRHAQRVAFQSIPPPTITVRNG